MRGCGTMTFGPSATAAAHSGYINGYEGADQSHAHGHDHRDGVREGLRTHDLFAGSATLARFWVFARRKCGLVLFSKEYAAWMTQRHIVRYRSHAQFARRGKRAI